MVVAIRRCLNIKPALGYRVILSTNVSIMEQCVNTQTNSDNGLLCNTMIQRALYIGPVLA